MQRCLWQQCLFQSNFDATSKWQTIYLTWNYLNIIGYWHAYCSTRKLLSEESNIKRWLFILQGVSMGKGYSLIPNLWDWETHWKQGKKNWKNKALTCEIFFLHSMRNFVSPHSHVIIMLYISYTSWLVFLEGFNVCSFFPLYINSRNFRSHPANDFHNSNNLKR